MKPSNEQDLTKKYYDESDYFEKQFDVFSNLDSSFQKYRIKNVLEIYPCQKWESVVDLGCGWGTFCFALAERCGRVVGVDFSEKSIEICQRLVETKHSFDNVQFISTDARKTGLEPESFDVVICADLVEHLYPEAFEELLIEIKRILEKGGKVVIWTPNKGHFLEFLKNRNIILRKDLSHVDYKSMDRLTSSLKKQGFIIKKAYYKESHLPVLSSIERLFMKFLPFLRRRIAILAEKKPLQG